MNPTRAEKLYWNKLVDIVGCIACRADGIKNNHVSIHHVDGRTKPGCHMAVLPLCGPHHQTGGESAPSIHPWRRRFVAKYGSEDELMRKCRQIIDDEEKTTG